MRGAESGALPPILRTGGADTAAAAPRSYASAAADLSAAAYRSGKRYGGAALGYLRQDPMRALVLLLLGTTGKLWIDTRQNAHIIAPLAKYRKDVLADLPIEEQCARLTGNDFYQRQKIQSARNELLRSVNCSPIENAIAKSAAEVIDGKENEALRAEELKCADYGYIEPQYGERSNMRGMENAQVQRAIADYKAANDDKITPEKAQSIRDNMHANLRSWATPQLSDDHRFYAAIMRNSDFSNRIVQMRVEAALKDIDDQIAYFGGEKSAACT